MAASAVPGRGKMPTLAAPADNSAGIAVMQANIAKMLALKNTSPSWAQHAAEVLQQASDWAATQTGV